MKISVIDIGSNSVRLATVSGGKTLYKKLITTRLGEGLALSGVICQAAMQRTAQAVAQFNEFALSDGAQKVYAFATAAVRSAENGKDFVSLVKNNCGVQVEVLSGEDEAKCGLLGALRGKDGGIIDVGGASTEVTFQKDNVKLYSKSVNIGTVRLFDAAGRDKQKLLSVIEEKIKDYGEFSAEGAAVYAIGGTATRLAAIKHGITQYNPEVTDGTVLTLENVLQIADKLLDSSVEEIRRTTICGNSADVIGGGSLLMYCVMKKFGIESITVSESDNLEGFLLLKEGKV